MFLLKLLFSYCLCCIQLEKLAEVFVVGYLIFADFPVNPHYVFLSCLGGFFWWCLGFFLGVFLTSLAIKFPLILPVLTGNPNSLHLSNELILC